MRVWGKRGSTDALPEELEKRGWGKSKMRVWGKRGEEMDEDKSGWGDNKVRVKVERGPNAEAFDESALDEEKRVWSNNARLWGKRRMPLSELHEADQEEDNDALDVEKKRLVN